MGEIVILGVTGHVFFSPLKCDIVIELRRSRSSGGVHLTSKERDFGQDAEGEG
jgi:hypothetical protein